MELGLAGRVLIVAGVAKGLGRPVVEKLASESAQVAKFACTASPAEETAGFMEKRTGRDVLRHAPDVIDSAAVAVLVAAVKTRLCRTDTGVTNSGSPPSNHFKSPSPRVWRATADPLLMSNHLLAREILPRMQKNKWRHLIAIRSSAVPQPVDGALVRSLH